MIVKTESLLNDPALRKPEGGLYEREFWGISRHEAIAGAAEQFLTDKAKGEVARIVTPLGAGMGLADLAGWADRIKRHTPDPNSDDPDTVAFLTDGRNRRHDTWHFVNVPVDADGYDRARYPEFTNDEDVVQMMRHAALVLCGDSDRFSELSALRLISHLAGDVHQPIHVGCCYIDASGTKAKLVRDPAVAASKHLKHDRGGNALFLPIGKNGVTLHSYWDSRLGGTTSDANGDDHEDDAEPIAPDVKRLFVRKLVEMTRIETRAELADAADATGTPPERWAENWANEAIFAAREAYKSLEIKGQHQDKTNQFDVAWEGKESYDARCAPIVRRQMSTATKKLAELLNTIWS